MVIVCLSHAAGIRIVDSENAVTSDASLRHGRLDAFVSEFMGSGSAASIYTNLNEVFRLQFYERWRK